MSADLWGRRERPRMFVGDLAVVAIADGRVLGAAACDHGVTFCRFAAAGRLSA